VNLSREILQPPDLSKRPLVVFAERHIPIAREKLYLAWTTEIDHWFAAPGSVLMTGEINSLFFFETRFIPEGESSLQRFPHYGRFINLIRNELIEMTWVTGDPGTKGAETVVKIEFQNKENGTLLKLTHSGFPDEESKNGHKDAWPEVLMLLEKKYI
jgi:uncharacterized protein YndB with AHSA1/START domain